ncbi:MAG: H+/Na+-translocating ferredoxin:NAD+ oxidoreductase subunit [Clostridiales bacterium]|nr:H+/Na+-translocating ferredoxin:NAD+ oxidoreductase subunit [Clostridiales bacterium]MDK2992499.1 H+/Na+-translocating ferredoxin:NAD+ oxidoreductase subunit [Clostridiales bacterium]
MRDILNLGFKLLLITAVAALALGVVNAITREPIKAQIEKMDAQGRIAVFSEDTEFIELDADKIKAMSADYAMVSQAFQAKEGGQVSGYAIKTMPSGYGGAIELTVGISTDGTLTGIYVGNNSETPGLGAKASEPKFKDQFKGKKVDTPLEVIKSGQANDNQVQAISGATITSRAVTEGVNTAMKLYSEVLSNDNDVQQLLVREGGQ